LLCETLAIGIEEGLEGQDPSVSFRQPRPRPVDSDGKVDVRDPHEVRTQVEYRCGRGETAAELTTVAISGFQLVRLCAT
jgi:hypothetical protein